MSSCRDMATALFMGDYAQKRRSYFPVRKGVCTFDYSKSNNIIVTGGKDAIVRVWNPYVPSKPVIILQGHKSAITYVIVHDAQEQVRHSTLNIQGGGGERFLGSLGFFVIK